MRRHETSGVEGISETEGERGSSERDGGADVHVERRGNFGHDEAASQSTLGTDKENSFN